MKQIVAVLVFTALAAVTFVVVRKLNEAPEQPATVPGATTGSTPNAAPRKPRPAPGDDGSRTITNPLGQEVTVSSSIADAIDAAADFDWTASAHGDLLVPMAERWSVDLDGVDLDADVLVSYDGGEITQDEFRKAVVTRLATPLVEALAAIEIGTAAALARGAEPRRMSEALKEERFERWCSVRGVDAETGEYLLGATNGLPGKLGRAFFDAAGDSVLVALSGVAADDAEAAPTETVGSVPLGVTPESIGPLLTALNTGWEQFDGHEGPLTPELEEAATKILVSLDQLALLRVGTARQEAAVRIWTDADHPLPEGAVAGVATGALPAGVAPWETADEIVYIAADDVWPLVRESYRDFRLEQVLREQLFFDVLGERLRAAGEYADDVTAWSLWLDENEEASRTLMGMRFLNLEVLGYPSLAYYRQMNRLLRGFVAMQPPGWQSEEVLREYYSRNRFLIEGWRASMKVALFPAQQPEEPFSRPDFDRALEEARAMRAEVDAGGDFGALCAAHYEELGRRYEEARGRVVAEEFSLAMRGGELTESLAELMKVMKESYYTRLLNGVSVIYNGVFELRDGAVSEPWRSPLGYVLISMDSATMLALEREYEDAEFQTRHFHRDASFIRWATDELTDAMFTVTRAD